MKRIVSFSARSAAPLWRLRGGRTTMPRRARALELLEKPSGTAIAKMKNSPAARRHLQETCATARPATFSMDDADLLDSLAGFPGGGSRKIDGGISCAHDESQHVHLRRVPCKGDRGDVARCAPRFVKILDRHWMCGFPIIVIVTVGTMSYPCTATPILWTRSPPSSPRRTRAPNRERRPDRVSADALSGIPFLPCLLLVCSCRKGETLPRSPRQPLFYGWGTLIPCLHGVSIVQGYVFARLIGRGKEKALSDAPHEAALLGYCKYADRKLQRRMTSPAFEDRLAADRHQLYTFQIASYEIDVYRGDVAAQHNFIDFVAAYVAMFPQTGRDAAMALSRPTEAERTHSLGSRRPRALRASGRSREERCSFANVLAQLVPHISFCRADGALCLAVRDRLHAPDLFRFRLQRYGHRAGSRIFRLFVPGKLPLSVYRKEHHGVLAALAHVAQHMVPGLSLYPRSAAAAAPASIFQHPRRLDGHRLLARRGVEFCFWGLFYAVLLMAEKFFLLPALKKGESSSRTSMCFLP